MNCLSVLRVHVLHGETQYGVKNKHQARFKQNDLNVLNFSK